MLLKTVLWVSRHRMTAPQKADLDRILGEEVRLLPWTDTVKQAEELLPLLDQADAAAVVLPPALLCRLLQLAGDKPVLQALSARKPTGRTLTTADGREEPEFAFVHQGWQQILKLELETRLL